MKDYSKDPHPIIRIKHNFILKEFISTVTVQLKIAAILPTS